MKGLLLCLAATVAASPALAAIHDGGAIKSTQVVAMSVPDLQDCLARSWGAPLLTTREGASSIRLGFVSMGTTYSVLVLTPVENGTKVERQGNRIGEGHLKKCVGRAQQ